MKFNEIVKNLKERKETISTMESCTGGGVANAITSCEGASEILKFSAVTYSNEYKIKMGVPEKTIAKYTVYSMETAHDMAKTISHFTNSTYGVGITGKLNRIDPKNLTGKDNVVYVSIYNKSKKTYTDKTITVSKATREENKLEIIDIIITMLANLLK